MHAFYKFLTSIIDLIHFLQSTLLIDSNQQRSKKERERNMKKSNLILLSVLAITQNACSVKSEGESALDALMKPVAAVQQGNNQQQTTPKTPLKEEDACGTSGSVQDRMMDCTRAPTAALGDYHLIYKAAQNTASFWLNMKTGLLVAGTKDDLSFNDAQKYCRSITQDLNFTDHTTFRVAMKSELISLIESDLNTLYPVKGKMLLTSDRDSDGWVEIYRVDRPSVPGQSEHGHPAGYRASALCVATIGTIQLTSKYTVSEPTYSESTCKQVLLPQINAESLTAKIQQKMNADAEFKCGSTAVAKNPATVRFACERSESNGGWYVYGNSKYDFNCF